MASNPRTRIPTRESIPDGIHFVRSGKHQPGYTTRVRYSEHEREKRGASGPFPCEVAMAQSDFSQLSRCFSLCLNRSTRESGCQSHDDLTNLLPQFFFAPRSGLLVRADGDRRIVLQNGVK